MMRRQALALLISVALAGCMSVESGSGPGQPPGCQGSYGRSMGPPTVPGLQGPYGTPVGMSPQWPGGPPQSSFQAQQMLSRSVPLDQIQFNTPATMAAMQNGMGLGGSNRPALPVPPGGLISPPGVPGVPGLSSGSDVMQAGGMNPAAPGNPMGMPPGFPPGGMPPMGRSLPIPPGGMIPPPGNGVVQAQFTQPAQLAAASGNPLLQRYGGQRTQVKFNRPPGMRVSWYAMGPDGKPVYSTTPLETPGRYNFIQSAIYRLKLTNLEGRPELEVYPTMEVVASNPKTEAFLSHSAVPVEFTNEDFKQIVDGNYVVKVIYLPDPQFQDVAGTGTDEILSTRLEPGADPIQEALRRGSILLVIRMGNVHQELEHSPPLGAPGSNQGQGAGTSGPGMAPCPPAMPGPMFGPDYPNRPVMQVPYFGAQATPGAPGSLRNMPGALPGSGLGAGTLPAPQAALPPTLPNLPPATLPTLPANPGLEASGPSNQLPPVPIDNLPPKVITPESPRINPPGPIPVPALSGSAGSNPATNLAVPPPALPPTAPASQVSPPGIPSGPPSSVEAQPGSPANSPRPVMGDIPGVSGEPFGSPRKRPSIFSGQPLSPGNSSGGEIPPAEKATPSAPVGVPTSTPPSIPAGTSVPGTEPQPVPVPVSPAPQGPVSNGKTGPSEAVPLPNLKNEVKKPEVPDPVVPGGNLPKISDVPTSTGPSILPETSLPRPALPAEKKSNGPELPAIPDVRMPAKELPPIDPQSSPAFPPTPGEIRPVEPTPATPAPVITPISQANPRPNGGLQRVSATAPVSQMPTTAELATQTPRPNPR